jgi:hypothetical protein
VSSAAETEPRRGLVSAEVASELPGLGLRWLAVTAAPGASPAGLRARLRDLSDRRRGLDAVALRTRPLPRAYRAFFRQIGLDPDLERVPAERAALDRLLHGAYLSRGRVADACLLAVVETAVGVWALDASAVGPDGPEIRAAESGALVVAGLREVLTPLFAEPAAPRTRSLVLYAIAVPGGPEIHLHEALFLAGDALAER